MKTKSEANREKNRAYYEANREQIAEQKRARYEANREQILEQKRAYREKMQPLLRAADVAEIVGAPATTVKRWAREGTLPSLKLGPKTLRFERQAVEKFIEDSRK